MAMVRTSYEERTAGAELRTSLQAEVGFQVASTSVAGCTAAALKVLAHICWRAEPQPEERCMERLFVEQRSARGDRPRQREEEVRRGWEHLSAEEAPGMTGEEHGTPGGDPGTPGEARLGETGLEEVPVP